MTGNFQAISKIQRIYLDRSSVEKWMIVSCAFSLVLVIARCIAADSIRFLFLVWNLFLAFIPYYVSTKLTQRPHWIASRWKFILLFIVWILFIPNTFYIITDLFHLEVRDDARLWFDLVVLFSFAWNGLLLGILSVRHMEKIFHHCFYWRNELFLFPVMWLNALGVYIGRFMRFNSWDVITNPFRLMRDIGYMLIHPFRNFEEWVMIGCFGAMLMVVYIGIRKAAASN